MPSITWKTRVNNAVAELIGFRLERQNGVAGPAPETSPADAMKAPAEKSPRSGLPRDLDVFRFEVSAGVFDADSYNHHAMEDFHDAIGAGSTSAP